MLVSSLFVLLATGGAALGAEMASDPAGVEDAPRPAPVEVEAAEPPALALEEGGEFWREWTNEDGSRTRQFATAPVFFQNEDSKWEPIDLTLEATTDGSELRPRRGPERLMRAVARLEAGRPTLRLKTAAGELQVSHPDVPTGVAGVRGQGQGGERRVTYRTAMSDRRDLLINATVDGWQESVVLHERGGSGSWRTELRLPDPKMTARQTESGVEVLASDGSRAGFYGQGLGWDSAEVPQETLVRSRLVQQRGDVLLIESSVDRGWLADPARVYPVTLDPTYTVTSAYGPGNDCDDPGDTYTPCDTYTNTDNYSGKYWANSELRLGSNGGWQQGSTTVKADAATYIKHYTDSWTSTGYHVSAATLKVTVNGGRYYTRSFDAYLATTRNPTRNTDSYTKPGYGSYQSSVSHYGTSGTMTWNVRDAASKWFKGSAPQYGIAIKAQTARDVNSFRQMYSGNAGYTYAPVLTITYDDTPPPTPSVSSSTHPSQTTWYRNHSPSLSFSASDAQSGVDGYSWVLDRSSATTPDTYVDGTATPGAASYSGLAQGLWYFHVHARNLSGQWSTPRHFAIRIDTVAPAVPSIGSGSHPNTAVCYTNASGSFSWSSSDANGVVYDYANTTSTATDPTSPKTTATTTSGVPLPQGTSYWHVAAQDPAGNRSRNYRQVRVDTTAPGAPTGLSSSTHPSQTGWYASRNPSVSWSAVSDVGCGTAGYSWHFSTDPNAVPDTSVDSTSASASTSSLPDGVYHFAVRTIDNVGYASGPSRYTIKIDGTKPVMTSLTTSTHPDPAVWYANSSPAFKWGGSDNNAVTGYDYVLDQTSGTTPTTPNSTATTWTGPAPNGLNYFHVRARDAAGNTSAPMQVALRVDTAVPTAPPNLRSTNAPTSRTWTVAWDPSSDSPSGVKGYSWAFNKGSAVTPDNIVDGSETSATSGLLDDLSTYYFTVKALDQAGNASTVSNYTINVDTRTVPGAPTGVVAKPLDGRASITWTAPTDTGGVPAADLSYSVEAWRSGATSPEKTTPLCKSTATSCPPAVVDGLTNGVDYLFKVYAHNVKGRSQPGVSNTVRPLATGQLTKTVTPGGVRQRGDLVDYTITVKNPNTGTALPVSKVEDTVPAALAVSASSLSATGCQTACTAVISGQKITLTDSTIPAGETLTIRYRVQVDVPEFSACTALRNTATTTDPYGTDDAAVEIIGCGAGLGVESWWSMGSTALGGGAAASVNPGNGNLVVEATDSAPMTARGRLGYLQARTYNSQEQAAATLPGSLGAGWRLDLGEAEDPAGGAVTGSALLVPRAAELIQTVTNPAAVTLVDRDGTRHLFRPRTLGTAIHTGGTLLDPNKTLIQRALDTAAGTAVCVDVGYSAPPGVDLGLWRYVKVSSTSTTPCASISDGNSVVLGYAAVRPDRLRTEYAATGELLSMIDGAGNELRYAYDGMPTGTLLDGVVKPGGRLRLVYEARSCTPADDGSGNPVLPAGCRGTTFGYAADGLSTEVTDPAGRTTRYVFRSVTVAGLPAPVKVLARVINPPETSGAVTSDHVDYSYQGDSDTTYGPTSCGGTALQLCSTTDARGSRTTFGYDHTGELAGAAVVPARVSSITDRRGTTTNWQYESGRTTSVRGDQQQTSYDGIDGYGRVGTVLAGPVGDSTGSTYPWLHKTVQSWENETGGGACEPASSTGKRANKLCQLTRVARAGSGTPDEVTTFGYNDTGRTVKISKRLQTDRAGGSTPLDTTHAFRKQYFDGTTTPVAVDEETAGNGAVTTATPPATTALFVLADLRQELSPRGNAAANPARYRTDYTVDAHESAQPSTRLVAGVCDGTAGNTGLVCAITRPYGAEDAATKAVTTHTYDAFGQKTTMRTANGNAALPQHEPYRYLYYGPDTSDLSGTTAAHGWLKAVTDPAGNYVAFGYDAAGNTARTWDRNATAATGATPAGFDPASAPGYAETLRGTGGTALSAPWRHVRSVRDPLGNTTSLQVDQHGNITRSTPPRGVLAGNTSFDTVTVYDAADAVDTVTVPAAGGGTATTDHGYDAFGNRTSTTGPRAGQASRAGYDSVNRQTSLDTARGPVAATGTDQRCRIIGAGGDAPFAAGATVCTTSSSYDELDNTLSSTDAEGQKTTFRYDSLSRRTEQVAPRKRPDNPTAITPATVTTKTLYDRDGNVTTVCNPRQMTEGDGDCTVTSPYATHTGYDVAGREVTVSRYRDPSTTTGSNRLTTTTVYDANGNAVEVIDPRGNSTTASFDRLDRLTGRTSPDDRTTSYQHDPVGNTTAVLAPGVAEDNPAGSTTANKAYRITGYSFDANNRLVDTLVALQVGTPTDPAAVNAAIKTAVPEEAAQVNLRSRVHYDPDGNVDARFSPRAFVNRPAGDPDPRFMLRVTHGADGRPSGQYSPRADATGGPLDDPTGNPAQSAQCAATAPAAGYPDAPPAYPADIKLCASTMTYDAAGNPDVLTLPSAAGSPVRQLRYAYTEAGDLAQVTGPDPAGGTTDVVLVTYARDAMGRPVKTLRDNNTGIEQTYTADGLVLTETGTASTAGVKHETRHGYDAAGQRIRTYRMRGAGTEEIVDATSYYADGLVRSVTTGGTVRPAGTGTEIAGTIVTSYTYDPNGNPVEVMSPAANHSLANPTSPDETNLGAPATSSYTKDNLLASSTQPIDVATGGVVTKARRTSYSYDNAGRKATVQVDLTGLLPVTGTPQRFTYYPSDRLREQYGRTDASGGSGGISSSYDATGALTSTTDTSAAGSRTVTASYYLDGLLRHTDADGRVSGYAYDGTGATTARGEGTSLTALTVTSYDRNIAGLPVAMSTAGRTGEFRWTHNTRGELTSETLPNGHVQQWTIDPGDSTITSTTVGPATDPVASYSYAYDELGRILSQTYTGKGATGSTVTDSKYAYNYDPAGRLSSFTDARGKRTLTFDHNSNRTAFGLSGEPDPIRFSYNADDSIKQSVTGSGGLLGGEITRSYSYETFGGLASDGCARNSYDGFDRLTNTAHADAAPTDCGTVPAASYRYDGLDRQVWRSSSASATTLVYDGLSSRLTRKSGTDAALYLLDGDSAVAAVDPDGQGIQYLSTDGTASTGVLTDSTGKITCTARYDAYGNPNGNSTTVSTGSCNTGSTKADVFYQGERKDTDTGTYQLGSRTYDPSKASFLTPDVYRTEQSDANVGLGVDPLTRNSYTYVNGDPINYVDPSGHARCSSEDRALGCYERSEDTRQGRAKAATRASATASRRAAAGLAERAGLTAQAVDVLSAAGAGLTEGTSKSVERAARALLNSPDPAVRADAETVIRMLGEGPLTLAESRTFQALLRGSAALDFLLNVAQYSARTDSEVEIVVRSSGDLGAGAAGAAAGGVLFRRAFCIAPSVAGGAPGGICLLGTTAVGAFLGNEAGKRTIRPFADAMFSPATGVPYASNYYLYPQPRLAPRAGDAPRSPVFGPHAGQVPQPAPQRRPRH